MTTKRSNHITDMSFREILRNEDHTIWYDHTTLAQFEDEHHNMSDHEDLGYDNPLGFFVDHRNPNGNFGMTYSRFDEFGNLSRDYRNYFPGKYINQVNSGHLPMSGFDQIINRYWGGGYATTLAAETNPSRPEVSLPTFFGEFKDLPGQIYEKGAKSLRDFGKKGPQTSSVGIQFGILPFVSDVLKMTRLSESIDKRVVELNNLAGKGGARVSRVLSKPKAHFLSIDCPQGFAEWDSDLSGTISVTTNGTISGVMRWLPQVEGNTNFPPGKIERANVRDLLLGIDSQKSAVSYAADAWELLPWSWFADWFGNFGDFLKANSNSAIATPDQCWITQRQDTVIKASFNNGQVLSHNITTKQRCAAVPSLRVTVPVLSNGQMSILIGLSRRAGHDITKIRDFANLRN